MEDNYIILDANNPKLYHTHIDILNECFGTNLAGHMQACYPMRGFIPGTECYIWFPMLFGNKSGWNNIVTNNGNTILEVGGPGCEEWKDNGKHPLEGYRLVFAKPAHDADYRFIGAFKNDRDNFEYMKHSYPRVATRIKLSGNPVDKIEFLD